MTPVLASTSASGVREAFDLLTRTILYSVILFLPGFAVAAFVAYRGLRNVILAGAIVLAMTGLSGWVTFWLYFVHPWLGHVAGFILCLLSLASLVWLAIKLRPDARSVLLRLLPPIGLTFSSALLVLSTGFMYGGTQDPIATAAVRFSHPLPADNYLPYLLAEDLRDGHVPKPFFFDWHSSDRPPLQTGIALSQYAFLARPRRFGYAVVGVIAQSLWIFGFWLLLSALKLSRRAMTLILLTCLLSGFVFVNTFFVWPKLLAAAYMLGFIACLVLLWPAASRSHSVLLAATGGVLLASSLLSHGVSLFAVIGLAITGLPFLPKLPLRRLALTFAIAFAVYLPWIAYQKFFDPPGDRLMKWHFAGVEPLDSRPFPTTLIESYSKLPLSQIVSNKRANFEMALGHETNFWRDLQRLVSDLIGHDLKTKADLPAIAIEMRGGAFFHFVECLGFFMTGPLVLFAGVCRRIRSPEWRVGSFFWAVTLATVIGWCILDFGPPTWTILHVGTAVMVMLAFAGSVLAMWAISPWFAYIVTGLHIALNGLLYGVLMNVNAGPEPLSRGYLRPGIVVLSLLAFAAVLYSLALIEKGSISAFAGRDLNDRAEDPRATGTLEVVG